MKVAISLYKYGAWPNGKLVGGDVDYPAVPFKPSVCLVLAVYCSFAYNIADVCISLADKKTTKDMTYIATVTGWETLKQIVSGWLLCKLLKVMSSLLQIQLYLIDFRQR
jgi:hypothetical protein